VGAALYGALEGWADAMTTNLKRFGWVVAVLAAAWTGSAAADATRTERAEAFIRTLADDAISDLTDETMPRAQRVENLRSIMAERFAGEKIAKWVLGRYWTRASAEQQERYLDVYRRFMIEAYVDRFTRYDGETLAITQTDVYNEKDLIVKSVMHRPGQPEPLKIDWRVRDTDDTLLVLDIMVEGVSMAQAQRAEFASALRQVNGDMDAFLDDLDSRIDAAVQAAQSVSGGD
jgi:phospholipid transport system substrate-binding protein